ncbi:MAG: hypothetical protein KF819_27215 [Labilithrix sp.]|nr:hypothetical protein [Labilithrix sp.]
MTCALVATASGCATSEPAPAALDESTGTTEQSIVAAAGNIMIWPAGPIAWDGLVGTWPISVWSSGAIGAIAFDMVGVSNIGVGLTGFDGMFPIGITTPWLDAFVPAAATAGAATVAGAPFLGAAGAFAPGFGFAGAYDPVAVDGFGFGAFAPGVGAIQATFADGVVAPGFAGWFTPTLTSSALMFTNLAAVDAFTPFTFNVTFTAASMAQASAIAASSAMAATSLSIFATPIGPAALTAAAIPFTSMLYPFMVPIVPFGAVGAPVVGAVGAPLL